MDFLFQTYRKNLWSDEIKTELFDQREQTGADLAILMILRKPSHSEPWSWQHQQKVGNGQS